jgi:hypothetical protein
VHVKTDLVSPENWLCETNWSFHQNVGANVIKSVHKVRIFVCHFVVAR